MRRCVAQKCCAQGQCHNTVRGQIAPKIKSEIKHNEKVCQTQELGSHIQGKGHNQGSEVKSFLCEYLKLAETNFI